MAGQRPPVGGWFDDFSNARGAVGGGWDGTAGAGATSATGATGATDMGASAAAGGVDDGTQGIPDMASLHLGAQQVLQAALSDYHARGGGSARPGVNGIDLTGELAAREAVEALQEMGVESAGVGAGHGHSHEGVPCDGHDHGQSHGHDHGHDHGHGHGKAVVEQGAEGDSEDDSGSGSDSDSDSDASSAAELDELTFKDLNMTFDKGLLIPADGSDTQYLSSLGISALDDGLASGAAGIYSFKQAFFLSGDGSCRGVVSRDYAHQMIVYLDDVEDKVVLEFTLMDGGKPKVCCTASVPVSSLDARMRCSSLVDAVGGNLGIVNEEGGAVEAHAAVLAFRVDVDSGATEGESAGWGSFQACPVDPESGEALGDFIDVPDWSSGVIDGAEMVLLYGSSRAVTRMAYRLAKTYPALKGGLLEPSYRSSDPFRDFDTLEGLSDSDSEAEEEGEVLEFLDPSKYALKSDSAAADQPPPLPPGSQYDPLPVTEEDILSNLLQGASLEQAADAKGSSAANALAEQDLLSVVSLLDELGLDKSKSDVSDMDDSRFADAADDHVTFGGVKPAGGAKHAKLEHDEDEVNSLGGASTTDLLPLGELDISAFDFDDKVDQMVVEEASAKEQGEEEGTERSAKRRQQQQLES